MRNTFVSKADLANAYFPHLSVDGARHKLMDLISSAQCVYDKLCASGYTTRQKDFSPAQVEIITNYFGNPFK